LCDGKTSIEYSGSPFVNVVQPIQHRPRPDGASHRAQPRFRCLQSERSTRSILVVVADEVAEHRPQVLLVEDDHVVQTFLAECPDNAFGNCVRTRRSNGRGDGIDTNALGAPEAMTKWGRCLPAGDEGRVGWRDLPVSGGLPIWRYASSSSSWSLPMMTSRCASTISSCSTRTTSGRSTWA
jgi:hypothetical protein